MIKIINRDTYHWDIYYNDKRAYCVRGEPMDIYIRVETQNALPNFICSKSFNSDIEAINHCVKLIVGRDK